MFSLPDEYLLRIGRLVTSFAALEDAVKIAVSALICKGGAPATTQVITSEMSFRNLRALFSSLFMLKSSDTTALDEAQNMVKRATNVEATRNIIIHSTWGVQYRKGGRQSVIRNKTTAKELKGLKQQRVELATDDLDDTIDEIINETKAWTDFLYKYLMPDSPVDPPYGDDPWT